MKVRYDGPRESVITTHGVHRKGEVKAYPDGIGRDLIENGIRNKFSEVTDSDESGSDASASADLALDQAVKAKENGKRKRK